MSLPLATQYGAYKVAHGTVNKTRQVVMLYEGVITFLTQAKEAIAAGHIEKRYELLTKASEVILGLQNAIDFEHGAQMAHVLSDFYSDQYHAIADIQATNNAAKCDAVIRDMRDMLASWRAIDKQTEAAAAAAVPMQMPVQAVMFSA
jgi:flagellar protein FliS